MTNTIFRPFVAQTNRPHRIRRAIPRIVRANLNSHTGQISGPAALML